MADTAVPPPEKPEWAPRMWLGCSFGAWCGLLWRNRFAVGLPYLYIVAVDIWVGLFHSFLRLVETLIYGRAIARTELVGPPIFIIGHWRTGTTLLHELMVQDPRFGFPTTYDCMDANHCILTARTFPAWFGFLMPKQRPMDKMKFAFDRPQEDEFAMCMLGMRSPYLTIAFPNHPPQDQEYLDLVGVPPGKLAVWKAGLLRFLKTVTYKQKKRLVLKSPPHTARVKVLDEMFPGAIYVHIVRNPFVVFPSTVKLWKRLWEAHGLQTPKCVGLEEQVFETYLRMHQRLDEARPLVAGRLIDVRYEALVADPEGTMRSVYERLNLGGWDVMQPKLAEFLATLKGYETNRYQLPEEKRAEVRRRWGAVAEKYGYDMSTPADLQGDAANKKAIGVGQTG